MLSIKTALGCVLLAAAAGFAGPTEKTPAIDARPAQHTPDTSGEGRALALRYCSGCHVFPEPVLLDKTSWTNGVLPNMAMRLGIRAPGEDPYLGLSAADATLLQSLRVYPDAPLISESDWGKIAQYYASEAPEILPPQALADAPQQGLSLFKASEYTFTKRKFPRTTLLKHDPKSGLLYIGDAQKDLFAVDKSFQLHSVRETESPPVDMDFPAQKPPRLLCIGNIVPSDLPEGRLSSLVQGAPSAALLRDLKRPVQFASGDLDQDGKEDILICEFGNYTGRLSLRSATAPQKTRILKETPGVRKAVVQDFNRDGKPDIMVLRAQAYEEISVFHNKGKGVFEEEVLIQLPPVYGASYFELADFNQDGHPDILLSNGDNWDYSPVLKPYHGIRIYLNDGRGHFTEKWFYPLYGASKALARDFDKDGDLDIAAVSFYADLEQAEQSFIYLSNEGDFRFRAFFTPEAANGKWLTMEAGDFDKDGDQDIVLGAYYHNLAEVTKRMMSGFMSFPQTLFLLNQSR